MDVIGRTREEDIRVAKVRPSVKAVAYAILERWGDTVPAIGYVTAARALTVAETLDADLPGWALRIRKGYWLENVINELEKTR
ncbi:hypothetical protein [Mycolicibacter kumamotonensis]|uniref:Uncharacterized protein n=1 Tax=Mycolicibacter kumamotonensis TaxID=354243 RepID=A0A1B8SL45_9MYCO|nr:hypothetical protein [Mycolicibacter kumamotonensis]OBY33448.1 hypothetical protein ACT18_00410 [Mycolicibacter kumamotonensis]